LGKLQIPSVQAPEKIQNPNFNGGSPLNIMFTLGLFGMITIPIGCIGLFVYTGEQLAKLFSRNMHKVA
jgi:hypothetical protein